jgi:hypothetical protein
VGEDPSEGQDVGVRGEGWTSERKVVHIAHADGGGRGERDGEQKKWQADPPPGCFTGGFASAYPGSWLSQKGRRCHR